MMGWRAALLLLAVETNALTATVDERLAKLEQAVARVEEKKGFFDGIWAVRKLKEGHPCVYFKVKADLSNDECKEGLSCQKVPGMDVGVGLCKEVNTTTTSP